MWEYNKSRYDGTLSSGVEQHHLSDYMGEEDIGMVGFRMVAIVRLTSFLHPQ